MRSKLVGSSDNSSALGNLSRLSLVRTRERSSEPCLLPPAGIGRSSGCRLMRDMKSTANKNSDSEQATASCAVPVRFFKCLPVGFSKCFRLLLPSFRFCMANARIKDARGFRANLRAQRQHAGEVLGRVRKLTFQLLHNSLAVLSSVTRAEFSASKRLRNYGAKRPTSGCRAATRRETRAPRCLCSATESRP